MIQSWNHCHFTDENFTEANSCTEQKQRNGKTFLSCRL